MKISNKNSFLRKHWDIIMGHMEKEAETSGLLPFKSAVTELMNVANESYFVTTNAMQIIASIDLKNAAYSILSSLPVNDKPIRIYSEGGENNCHAFRYDGEFLHISALSYEEGDGKDDLPFNYAYYKASTKTNKFHCSDIQEIEQSHFETVIMKVLVYIFLSDIDIKILPVNGDNGLSRAEGKVRNETTTPIKLVTEKWNTLTVRVGDFGVRGHMRLQPCGPNREQRRLIYIAPFLKHSYKRRN